MVDIGGKKVVKRTAIAEGYLLLKASTLKAIAENDVKKGDVFSASRLAGIQAAKATSTILPLCHQIPLTSIELDISVLKGMVMSKCTVTAEYKTGVEMEALVGVASSLLNVWDMVKYLEKNGRGQYPTTRMMDVHVLSKTKGGSRE
ncbi:MAG: cyclic pyranopterin monophosphate synthase MoaC [Candidatus Thermoplasmatota archaeon]|nr:cyclic pyranopterin monophosphate synthase MoaC [Candidatus Thermoplasmatota archaeon]